MSKAFLSRIGAIVSADIAVPDQAAVSRFYARVLSTGERPLWRDDLMNNIGLAVIGIGERVAEYAHLPLQWMPHIQVADVAAGVDRARALGGEVLMHGQDAHGVSQYAVLLDPNGAAFGLVPVVAEQTHEATRASQAEEAAVGRIAWLDLTVGDADTTRDFYRAVVGWTVQQVQMQDGDASYADYAMLSDDGEAVAGVCHARGVNRDLPPTWMLYLPVGDVQESLQRVLSEGGKVVHTQRGSNGEVAYSVIQDPAGAVLAISPA